MLLHVLSLLIMRFKRSALISIVILEVEALVLLLSEGRSSLKGRSLLKSLVEVKSRHRQLPDGVLRGGGIFRIRQFQRLLFLPSIVAYVLVIRLRSVDLQRASRQRALVE